MAESGNGRSLADVAAAVSTLGDAGISAAESEVAQALAVHSGIADVLNALRRRLEESQEELLVTPSEAR